VFRVRRLSGRIAFSRYRVLLAFAAVAFSGNVPQLVTEAWIATARTPGFTTPTLNPTAALPVERARIPVSSQEHVRL